MKSFFQSLMAVGFFLMLNACAFDVVRLKQIPVEIRTGSTYMESFTLTQNTKIDAGPGYSRILKSGSRWECVGELPQGKVYRTKDQVLTIEASNVFEANIVVADQKLIGYYLPVERSFSPLDDPLELPINRL